MGLTTNTNSSIYDFPQQPTNLVQKFFSIESFVQLALVASLLMHSFGPAAFHHVFN